jgi:hypothetical protein
MYDLNEVRGFASDIRWASLFGSLRPGVFDLAAGDNLFFIFFYHIFGLERPLPFHPHCRQSKSHSSIACDSFLASLCEIFGRGL